MPLLTKATTVSNCCANTVTRSSLPSWFRSTGTAWMAPGRGSMTRVTKEGRALFTEWFSRTLRLPTLRHPNAATARSSLRSPLKSAASTSATRGQPSRDIVW